MLRRGAVTVALVVVVAMLGLRHSALAGSARPRRLPLSLVTDVVLPGEPTRFDYQSVDEAARRLYLAHLGDSTVDVVDLSSRRVIAAIPGIASVHGVAVAPEVGRVYATATGTNQLATIDAATQAVVARAPTGRFPDGVTFDQRDELVLVSNKDDGTITVVNAVSGAVTATIKVADETGNVTFDDTRGIAYVAARRPDALVAFDPTTRRITRRLSLPGCDGAHGVYLDPGTQRAFVACENNARLVTVDLRDGRNISTDTLGRAPDVLAYDLALRQLYVASESGTVTVFDTTRRAPRKIGEAHLPDGAHSVAVDQSTHHVFFPLASVRGRAVLRIMAPPAGGEPSGVR